MLRSYRARFLLVHIGDPSSNQATTLESHMIHMIQELFGQTLSGVNALVRDFREKDLRTKKRPRATGATHGGILFERGSLFYLLRNRFYIGDVKYKGEILPGEQPVIMDRELFYAVEQKL